MALKVGIANGNWSTAAVWDEVSNVPTSHASTNITLNATKYTAAFTAPVVDGVCAATGVALFAVTIPSAACTVTVTLQENSAGWVDCAAGAITASIDMATVYASIGGTLNNWLYFRVPTPFIFLSATAGYYRWKITYTGAATTTLMADAAGTAPAYWSTHIIAVPAIPANTDLVLIPGQNATSTIKVSVDGTRTIGNLTNTAACSQMRPATASLWWDVQVGYGGELNYDNTASATLNCKGCLAVGTGGTYRMDNKAGAAYAAAFIATFTFTPTANGDCGIGIFDKSKFVLQGQPKTTTALYKTHPDVNWVIGDGTVGHEAVTDDIVNWAVNDEILIGPTGDYDQTEYKFVKTVANGNTFVFSATAGGAESGFTYGHTTDAWILNLTRNVVINTNDAAKGFYIYGVNTLTTGGIDIDWARFGNVCGPATNKTAIALEYTSTSFANLDYSVVYNTISYGFYIRSSTINSYNGLIGTKSTGSANHFGAIVLYLAKNKTINNSFGINSNRNAFYIGLCANCILNNSYSIACNTDNANPVSGYGGILIQSSGNITLNSSEIHLTRGYGLILLGANSDIQINSPIFGTKGANTIADIYTVADGYFANTNFEDSILNTIIPANYNTMAIGSQINFDTLGGTAMKHFFYRATGVGQATGAGLDDTKVRTAGSYGLLMSPDATTGTSGMKKTFYVLARPSSQVVVYGYLWRNAPACTINLYLPGSITPDATQTFTADTDIAWQNWIVSANYTGTLPKLAKVEIIVTGTSGGVYFDDILNGTNLLGALDVWNNGDIIPIIYDELGDAGAVWAYTLSNSLSGDANLTGLKTTLGVAGAGLTALGDTRIANLDAQVSTRSTLTAQQVWEYTTRTLSSFGTLVADAATAVWGAITRSLTDKAGFTISGTKQTLDTLQDLSQAGAQAGAAAALTAQGYTTARAPYLDELAAANLPADVDGIKGKTVNLPSDPADQSAIEAAITAAVSPLAIEANVQTHTAAAITAYDPPTRAEATADKDEVIAAIPGAVDLTALTALVTRALGLAGENMVMDQTVFDADKKLTSARIRIYDSAAHALAAGDTGLIATFPLTMTWATKLLETMTQVKS